MFVGKPSSEMQLDARPFANCLVALGKAVACVHVDVNELANRRGCGVRTGSKRGRAYHGFRAERPTWRRTWAFCVALAPTLGLIIAPAVAAPTACPDYFASGRSPEIIRPSLAARVRELCLDGYAVLHSGISRTPLAVAEHLTRAQVMGASEVRREGFYHDENRLPSDERARLSDYDNSGFDRGQMAPSGDMATSSSMAASFSLANIVPQHPGSSRCLWKGVETSVRAACDGRGRALRRHGLGVRGRNA